MNLSPITARATTALLLNGEFLPASDEVVVEIINHTRNHDGSYYWAYLTSRICSSNEFFGLSRSNGAYYARWQEIVRTCQIIGLTEIQVHDMPDEFIDIWTDRFANTPAAAGITLWRYEV